MDEVMFSHRTQDNIDFDYENIVNEGALCPRGHFSYELLSHPMRLGRAYFKDNGTAVPMLPDIIFQRIAREMKEWKPKFPLALLIDPTLSLHEIRALLEFAQMNKISAVDFVAPYDRHMFRALSELPFEFEECPDARLLKDQNYVLTIGDVFTKEPVLSRHLLQSKYAFRANALFHIDPLPSRTSWFANGFIQSEPHLEPLLLFKLLKDIWKKEQTAKSSEILGWLVTTVEKFFGDLWEKKIPATWQPILDRIAAALTSDKKKVILFSTQIYNAAGGYLSAIACAALSKLTGSFFIPLYSKSNMRAIRDLASQAFPGLAIGKKAVLHDTLNRNYHYIFAAGWNPLTAFPGELQWPADSRWIISSLVKGDFPGNTVCLLPQAHAFEQMDLRANFLPLQSAGSEPVKTPIGSALSLSHFIYLLYQKLSDEKVSIRSDSLPTHSSDWKTTVESELEYYRSKIAAYDGKTGVWMVPEPHVAHFEDAFLSRYSSWARLDCADNQVLLPAGIAQKLNLKESDVMSIQNKEHQAVFQISIRKKNPENVIIPFAHYTPVRRMMEGEFAPHNREYYFWCPKINL
ncbi:MAG: hypothetical protein Kow0042_31380 [Calditrichia bacterium]